MASIDGFLPAILPYVNGCAEPIVLAGVVKAAQDFCERTRLWRYEGEFAVTSAGSLTVTTPEDSDLFEIENAMFDGLQLESKSIGDLNRDMPDWRDREGTPVRWITQTVPGVVVVVPRSTGTLKLSIFLRPSDAAEQLPDFLLNLYRRVIADGALAEILMTPDQPFTAPDRAQFYSMRFEQRLGELSARTIKGQQRARLRSRARFL